VSARDVELQQILLGGVRAPRGATREDRVRLLGEFAAAVLAGRQPDRASAVFVAGALHAWLERGGSLERDFLRVRERGSHRTPAAIWREALIDDERQPGDGDASSARIPSVKGPT
jgi:hypothetical protein